MSGFTVFSSLSDQVEAEYKVYGPNPWEASPFLWIWQAPSATKGAVGKKLVRLWAEREGLQVANKSGRGHAFRVGQLRVAVKLSLVWADGLFAFEQIKQQPYDAVSLLALEPQKARLWVVPKEVLWNEADWQHRGAAGRDTKWLHVNPTRPPSWLQAYGGALPRARRALEQARDELSG